MREKRWQSRALVFASDVFFGVVVMLIVLTAHVPQLIARERNVLFIVNGKCHEGPCCDDSTLDRYEVEYKYRLEKAGFIVFPMAWDAIDPSINLSDYAFVFWNDYTGGGINDPSAPILIDALVAQKVPFMTPNPKFAILWDLATSNGPNMYGDTEWLRETYIEPLEVHSKLFYFLNLNSFPLQLGDRIQISRDSGNSPYIGVLADDATLSPDAIKIASAYDKVMGNYDLAIVMFPPGARQPNAAYSHNPPTAPFIHLGMGDEVPDVNPYCPSISLTEYANDYENFWVIFTNAAKYLAEATACAQAAVPVSNPIPDTGQSQSYTDTFGEDSDYAINPQSYTKLDEQGNSLPDSALSWSMVKDNVTGLIWENKTDDGSIHDKDNTYNWNDTQNVFIANLNATQFGGLSDWRLPTVKELSFIVNSGTNEPAIDTAYFPRTIGGYYQSSTTHVFYTHAAWGVHFSYGLVYPDNKLLKYYVRAVRGGQSEPFDNLIIGNGTVTDSSTGLMWQRETTERMNPEEAISYCENLSLGGYNDWRLPNKNELQSLTDYTRYNPVIDTTAFPNIMSSFPNTMNTMSSVYWSSTTYTNFTPCIWIVDFGDGSVNYRLGGLYYVRAVRGGGALDNLDCVEDDSGLVDIKAANGAAGEKIQILVRIQNASNKITSLGFKVNYDTAVLEYSGFESGGLVKSFNQFEVHPDPDNPGKLIAGGFTTRSSIPQGASGDLAYLKFTVKGGQESDCYPLQMEGLKDDIAGFSSSQGCFCIRKPCTGDLNEDGSISPSDALTAFKCYLKSGPCADCADVNKDGSVTPSDALCVFKRYLGQSSCLD